MLGILELRADQPEEALKYLEQAIRLDPNSVTGYFVLGSAYGTLNRWDDSLRALETGERLQPNSWQLQYELARAYLGKDDYAASLQHSSQGLKLAGEEFPALHFLRARALLGLEKYPEAIVELEAYLSRDADGPNAPEARHSLQQARVWASQQQSAR
jgi:predicted Zn-dependent protease